MSASAVDVKLSANEDHEDDVVEDEVSIILVFSSKTNREN